MTVEQLEELLERHDPHSDGYIGDNDLYAAERELSSIALSLGRRVLAAEKLVEALDSVLEYAQGADPWHGFKDARAATQAYREASK